MRHFNSRELGISVGVIWTIVLASSAYAETLTLKTSEIDLVKVLAFAVMILVGAINSLVVYIFTQKFGSVEQKIEWIQSNCLTESQHTILCKLAAATTELKIKEEEG